VELLRNFKAKVRRKEYNFVAARRAKISISGKREPIVKRHQLMANGFSIPWQRKLQDKGIQLTQVKGSGEMDVP
jgi:hypothetical protein